MANGAKRRSFSVAGIAWAGIVAWVLLAVLCGAGCSRPPAPPTPQPTDAPAPTREPSPAFTYEGWQTYANQDYGFTLRYPADWEVWEDQRPVSTTKGHAIWLRPRGNERVRLVITFKRAGEDQLITRTGVGAGDLVDKGTVVFLGRPVARTVLVCEGKDMSVLYDGSAEVRRGDLVFALSLDYVGSPTDPVTLTAADEAAADRVVESLALLK